jgi:hypothetical protein
LRLERQARGDFPYVIAWHAVVPVGHVENRLAGRSGAASMLERHGQAFVHDNPCVTKVYVSASEIP